MTVLSEYIHIYRKISELQDKRVFIPSLGIAHKLRNPFVFQNVNSPPFPLCSTLFNILVQFFSLVANRLTPPSPFPHPSLKSYEVYGGLTRICIHIF